MSIFRRPDYQSETTQFLNELKKQNPRWNPSSWPVAPCCGTRT
jgi:hypothetical protein